MNASQCTAMNKKELIHYVSNDLLMKRRPSRLKQSAVIAVQMTLLLFLCPNTPQRKRTTWAVRACVCMCVCVFMDVCVCVCQCYFRGNSTSAALEIPTPSGTTVVNYNVGPFLSLCSPSVITRMVLMVITAVNSLSWVVGSSQREKTNVYGKTI